MKSLEWLIRSLVKSAALAIWLKSLTNSQFRTPWIKSILCWSGVGLLLTVASVAWFRRATPIERTERRIAANEVAGCAECHATQTEHFFAVPHAQTLRRADRPSEWVHFASKTARIGQPVVEFRYWAQGDRLWCDGGRASSTAVDWIFGSGHHGQTAVSVRTNERGESLALEHHVTWYSEIGLDRTIGRPSDLGNGKNDVGELNTAETTRQCFGCHTTVLPENEHRIDLEQLVPGVLCSRCHLGAHQHAIGMKSGNVSVAKFDDRRKLSPFESIARCGECHRLPTSFSPKELVSQNSSLPRFAPVGLLMSKCFQLQHTQPQTTNSIRLDCVTCHDPHRPTKTDPDHYNQSCRQCHSEDDASLIHCSRESLKSNCIGCHMPKVSVNAPAMFTDHWIRVREP